MPKPWWDSPNIPWYAGLMSDAEADELDREFRTKMAIKEYLNRPRKPRVTIDDHGPWDQLSLTCLGCGRTLRELHYYQFMPECKRDS